MKLKKILVTGGAGFIGSHLVDELLRRGFEVTVLDNLSNGSLDNLKKALKNNKFHFIKGDVLNIVDCQKATKKQDVVFHLACLGIRHSIHSPFENHRVNAEGTLRILQASLKNKIEKFFYISSSEIYGDTPHFPVSEKDLPCPTTIYGASKLAGEHYSLSFHKCYGLDATILRIFNNYGPRAHFEGDAGEIIPRTIVSVIYDKSPVIFGKGDVTRDYFFVRDTAFALSELIEKMGIDGKTINIGTGKEIKMIDLIKNILRIMGKGHLEIIHKPSRPADLPRLWVNTTQFNKITSFKPRYDFQDGLKETIKYYTDLAKNNKELYEKIKIINWAK